LIVRYEQRVSSSPLRDAPLIDGAHPQRWQVLAVLCVALCAIVIDNTVLSIAVPSIARELDASETDLQWITAAYALVLSGLLLPLAVLGDRFGRRRLFIGGLLVFGVASTMAAFSGSALSLIVCRGAMGIGGAAAMPATLAIIGNVFSPQERGRALAVWSGVAGFAAAAGPLLGGALLSRFWWGSVFLVNIPIVVGGVIAALLLVPESRDPGAPRIDWPGAALWTGALVGLLFGIIEGPERGWTSATVLAPIAATIVLLAGFARREKRAPAPLLSPATARHPGMRAGAAVVPAVFFALFGTQFVLTQWLQGPRGLSTIAAAACFLPNALISIVGSFSSSRVIERIGVRSTIRLGVLIMGCGLVLIGGAIASEVLPLVVAGFGIVGLGQGLVIPTGVELIMTSASSDQAGSAAGVNETIVEAGGALGVAVMGSVLIGMSSFSRPLVVAALVLGLGAFVSLRVQRTAVATADL
jgi:MFS family permease